MPDVGMAVSMKYGNDFHYVVLLTIIDRVRESAEQGTTN